jgi:predicted PurR-regulated permease PerM
MESKRQLIDVSIFTIIKFFLVVVALFFLYLIKEVLALIFVALIFAAAVDPWVDRLEKYKFPRGVSILLIYLVLFSLLFLVVYLLIPPIITQVGQLAENFPLYYERVASLLDVLREYSAEHGVLENIQRSLTNLRDNLFGAASSIFNVVVNIFGGIFSFFVILVITFYLTVEESALKRTLIFLPRKYQDFSLHLVNKVQEKIGQWLKGQLVLCLIIGLMTYVGLLILGVNYALVLALVAGIGELIPYIGPIISAVPAVFLAFTQSPVKALLVVILFVVIQQVENHILAPKVMQKAVGLNPIISIVALLIGAKIGGIVGIILAIPVATAISVVVSEFWSAKEKFDTGTVVKED